MTGPRVWRPESQEPGFLYAWKGGSTGRGGLTRGEPRSWLIDYSAHQAKQMAANVNNSNDRKARWGSRRPRRQHINALLSPHTESIVRPRAPLSGELAGSLGAGTLQSYGRYTVMAPSSLPFTPVTTLRGKRNVRTYRGPVDTDMQRHSVSSCLLVGIYACPL